MEIKRVLPSISFVVARSYPQNLIGYENRLLWHLKTDLQFFKKTTTDHAVIMGRKTFESIGRPLPNRLNIVLSRSPGNNSTNLQWVTDRENALFAADVFSILNGKKEVFVIGGDAVYRLFMDLFNKVFLTQVFARFPKGDYAKYEFEPDGREWRTLAEEEVKASKDDEYPFRITIMERRRKTVRQRELTEFLTEAEQRNHWISKQTLRQKWIAYSQVPEEQFDLLRLLGRPARPSSSGSKSGRE